MLEWLQRWEPLWLFILLSAELCCGIFTVWVLVLEFYYDKAFNESIRESRKERRRKKYEFENLTNGEGK